MMELLHTCQKLVVDVATTAWSLITLVLTFCWDVLYSLHVTSPRLEGLLVGLALTWLMLRRDKHPALRVLSSPLKLVLDILDLAWNQVVEIVTDAWDAVHGWVWGARNWCWAKVVGLYNWNVELLKRVKVRLSSK